MAASTSKATERPYRVFPDYAREGGYVMDKREAHSYEYRLVAVDPGGVHVGVAVFGMSQEGWRCIDAFEMAPEQFEDWLSEHMVHSGIDILVVESWKLFGGKAKQQTGSDMPTSQLIGVIKYIHRHMKSAGARWPRADVELYFQDPDIKVPITSVLRNRGIKSLAVKLKAGGHAKDAELHGYNHIIHTLDEPLAPRV